MNKENLEKIFNEDLGTSFFPQLAEEYIKEGDYELAKKVCNVGLLLNPHNNDGKYILAKIMMVDGDGKDAEGILKEYPALKRWTMDLESKGLTISAERTDPYFGTHIVSYDSSIDTIELKHEAHSRDGFALGAVIAAEWLPGKKGPHNMKDVLGL